MIPVSAPLGEFNCSMQTGCWLYLFVFLRVITFRVLCSGWSGLGRYGTPFRLFVMFHVTFLTWPHIM